MAAPRALPGIEVVDETGGREFLFSVVIPVYNTEEYVDEAVDSLVAQTVGFERNIQVVLVNDGSTDGSAAVCREYRDRHPGNVVFADKPNGGVSAARNLGVSLARGMFVNFLDSDDVWSDDAFLAAAEFFLEHPDVSIATARHEFFGRDVAPHALTYKYEADRVVDIFERPDHPQLSFSNVFAARELIPDDPFDPGLAYSEDFLALNEILLREGRYGILSKPKYGYRKRADESSAIDRGGKRETWYLDTPRLCYRRLFDLSTELYGEVVPYIQCCVMYDLQWRLRDSGSCPLSGGKLGEYRDLIASLLRDIDDEVIVAQRNSFREEKLLALALKHGTSVSEIRSQLATVGDRVVWRQPDGRHLFVYPATQDDRALVERMAVENGKLAISGRLLTMCSIGGMRMVARTESGEFECALKERLDSSSSSPLACDYYTPIGFEASIPLETVEFFTAAPDQANKLTLKFGKFSPISNFRKSYAILGGFIAASPGRHDKIEVTPCSPKALLKHEAALDLAMARSGKQKRKLVKYRHYALACRALSRKRIWLLSDRPTMANDNGEALFEYLAENPVEGVTPYFMIRRDSPDYARMREIGKVVPFGSMRHFCYALRAEAIVSSAGEDNVFNPFGKQRNAVSDLLGAPFVFLQHGVIKDDLSGWLKKPNKNIALFITSAPRERDSIVENPKYGYSAREVLCSGLPRHDKLIAKASSAPPRKRLLIAPTWRKGLANTFDQETGMRLPNPEFEVSDYFKFFNGLLNDERLIGAAREAGFEVRFLLHPSLAQELHKFSSEYCQIVDDFDYSDEIAAASIMLTDYSSVVFDFALLKRPVIYAQTDPDAFFASHTLDKGYFDYERDGFGPVCSSYEETVAEVIEQFKKCQMDERYLKRVEDFFFQPDQSRCSIVIEAIEELTSNGSEGR